MPAFDPVRDAVLNSPITSSLPLPSSARMHVDTAAQPKPSFPSGSFHQPHSSTGRAGMSIVTSTTPGSAKIFPSDSSPGAALVSPLTRRATDLSMLLNSDPPAMDTPLFTPTTPRAPATLSHLLLPDSDDNTDNEQLSHTTPLRRRSSATMSDTSIGAARERESSYFTHSGGIYARPRSSSSFSLPQNGPPAREREPFGLAFPGGVTPIVASTTSILAFPSSSGSRSSPVVPFSSGAGPASRSSVAGQPLSTSSSASASTAFMPPPAQAPPRSPVVSTSSLPLASTSSSMAPPPHRAPRPASPSKRLHSTPAAPAPPPPPISASPAPPLTTPPPTQSTSSTAQLIQKPSPPQQRKSIGNGVSPKPLPPSSLPPPSSGLPPKPMPPPSPPPSQPRRSAIPYAPRRITPAGSVLVPLSPAEMERYRNYTGGAGTMILRKQKRVQNLLGDGLGKRERSPETSEESPRKKRRSGDVAVVVEHYNARPDVGVAQRQDSPIIGLKSFNNWVKSVLITKFAHPAFATSPNGRKGRGMRGRVLDMGCGKGGDLTKWAKANVAELNLLSTPFDVVSMQFCMHYAFENENKARTMLHNVCTWLRPGGIFIGTIPDAKMLMDQLDALPPDSKDLSFGNSVYKIRFEDRDKGSMFGHRYWFYLQDAVDDVPEYVVQWDPFVQLASEYGLHPVYKKEFHQVFEEFHEQPEFAPLLQRMRVVDSNGESQMDEDQWEAANIYIGFAFEKR
ncbi:mRNA capping enzyme-domain-containing protein [Ganoderma leucocontextum]|nr:mRNA capping enzyme-domain-containing protein [Ganoderma leucocontextum]